VHFFNIVRSIVIHILTSSQFTRLHNVPLLVKSKNLLTVELSPSSVAIVPFILHLCKANVYYKAIISGLSSQKFLFLKNQHLVELGVFEHTDLCMLTHMYFVLKDTRTQNSSTKPQMSFSALLWSRPPCICQPWQQSICSLDHPTNGISTMKSFHLGFVQSASKLSWVVKVSCFHC
jgi:hypothetical protein